MYVEEEMKKGKTFINEDFLLSKIQREKITMLIFGDVLLAKKEKNVGVTFY